MGYVPDFHKAVNLVPFNLAEVFVIHRVTSTCRGRLRKWNLKHVKLFATIPAGILLPLSLLSFDLSSSD